MILKNETNKKFYLNNGESDSCFIQLFYKYKKILVLDKFGINIKSNKIKLTTFKNDEYRHYFCFIYKNKYRIDMYYNIYDIYKSEIFISYIKE